MDYCFNMKAYKVINNNSKVLDFQSNLQKTCMDFQEILLYFENIYSESENYKNQLMTHKQQCESNKCCSAERLSQVVETKDNIINSIASLLTKLNRTKNLDIVDEIFKVIYSNGDVKSKEQVNGSNERIKIKKEVISPAKSKDDVKEDSSLSESNNDVHGTISGRTSPIIQLKKSKINYEGFESREKLKCPSNWVTPEKKTLKLVIPSGKKCTTGGQGKARQARLSYVKSTPKSNVMDLTCSLDFNGGSRSISKCSGSPQPLVIKKELMDNDDTIMPSPTSGSNDFPLLKPSKKLVKVKKEKENVPTKPYSQEKIIEDFMEGIAPSEEPREVNKINKDGSKRKGSIDNDVTHCEDSVSILRLCSPTKRPLMVNNNATNKDVEGCMDSSVSVLRPERSNTKISEIKSLKKTVPEPPEPIYKEPTVRKKSEKRALPGWICQECKNFYGELYEDDPTMLSKMINECSKHRGRRDPIRPKTPPNFWNPRWDVPQDTAEFNRMNDAT